MGRNRAAYMREYRARKNATRILFHAGTDDAKEVLRLRARISELEEEVRHLKAELAKRPQMGRIEQRPKVDIIGDRDSIYGEALHDFNTRPFTPVPKVRK